MKYILIGIILICSYIFVTLAIARFCGLNTRLEEELNKNDRSNSE